MASFDFITAKVFRESLEADYSEMNRCSDAQAWKSVQVLAGSIVEALLIDYLASTKHPARSAKEPLKMDLSEAIAICRSETDARETAGTAMLKVYWQPGCSSCLKTKEFLTEHGVPFVSVNVLADEQGFRELAQLGLRRVPIVRRGSDWVDGQVIRDVARIAGLRWDAAALLPPADLAARGDTVLNCALRLAASIP